MNNLTLTFNFNGKVWELEGAPNSNFFRQSNLGLLFTTSDLFKDVIVKKLSHFYLNELVTIASTAAAEWHYQVCHGTEGEPEFDHALEQFNKWQDLSQEALGELHKGEQP